MSATEAVSRQLWSDAVYRRVPLNPLASGALLAALLLVLLAVLAWATGELGSVSDGGVVWWRSRDARLAVLVALLAGTIPTALRYHELGTRRNLEALAEARLYPGEPPEALRRATSGDPRRALWFGASGLLLVPLVALSVDRDPVLYLSPAYWRPTAIWVWIVGSFATFTGGILIYRVSTDARRFASLARELPAVDLLEREALLPFARQGLLSAMPGVLSVAFLALNVGDEGFLLAIVGLGLLVLVQNVAMLLVPVRGLHRRLRAAKREELARVNAALRGDPGALRGSPIGSRESPGLTDLLAWRRFVESVPEWPIDLSTLGRTALYVGIPLFSWVGAALVERLLDLWIE